MTRNSVLAAAVAAMVWAAGAQAQDSRTSTQSSGYSYQQSSTVSGDSRFPEKTQEDVERELRGVSVVVGAGVEGYSGSLAPRMGVGPAWNLLIDFHPTSVLGLELAYVGAINSVKYGNFGLTTQGGADIVRNAAMPR